MGDFHLACHFATHAHLKVFSICNQVIKNIFEYLVQQFTWPLTKTYKLNKIYSFIQIWGRLKIPILKLDFFVERVDINILTKRTSLDLPPLNSTIEI